MVPGWGTVDIDYDRGLMVRLQDFDYQDFYISTTAVKMSVLTSIYSKVLVYIE